VIPLGAKQKKILEILTTHPDYTVSEVASIIYEKKVMRRSKEYNSTCRSFHMLEEKGLVEQEGGQVKWRVKPKNP
jgi:DNA-binding IclR family transcriptional regulator